MTISNDKALRSKLRGYVASDRKLIHGWFSRVDGEIFSEILQNQNARGVRGGCMEIGVHHGKSFIPLSLSMPPTEVAIAVDIFDRQDLNIVSRSGRGNYQRFIANVRRYGSEATLRTISSSSLDVERTDVLALTPGLRFVSIDGGHWYGVVLHDLRLAAACAGNDCVIAIDDAFNPDFAEVAAAYYAWVAEKPDFAPFAASRGKLYLCRPGAEQMYQRLLMANDHLKFNRKKILPYMGGALFLFTGNYGGVVSILKKFLEVHAPSIYLYLKTKARA